MWRTSVATTTSCTTSGRTGCDFRCCPPRNTIGIKRSSRVYLSRFATAATNTCLESSSMLALSRAVESASESPLFIDPYAQQLAQQVALEATPLADSRLDVISTKYIDDNLLTAVSLVNMDLQSEYRQVVLLGCGMDTRPYRLLWPEGTVIYSMCSPEVHEVEEAVVKLAGAHVPRGCLLRRVAVDIKGGHSFESALERSGYRGDRLSIWAIQGLRQMGLDVHHMRALLANIANVSAYDSIIMGELPPMTKQQAENLLGESGLLGLVVPFGDETAHYGVWEEGAMDSRDGTAGKRGQASTADAARDDVVAYLFRAQHKRLSSSQMDVYNSHVAAVHETDEDFFGHFS